MDATLLLRAVYPGTIVVTTQAVTERLCRFNEIDQQAGYAEMSLYALKSS